MGASVTGSDVSPLMIANNTTYLPHIPFIYCDCQKVIPVRHTVDYIFAFEVLEHLGRPEKGVRNIYGALKPGGWFIGSTPYPYKKNLNDPTHKNVKYPDAWKRLFVDAGFRNVSCRPLSFPPVLWRIHRLLNIPLPFYISLPGFVSTTLIFAQR